MSLQNRSTVKVYQIVHLVFLLDFWQSTSRIHGLDNTSNGSGVRFRRIECSHYDIIQNVLCRCQEWSLPFYAESHQHVPIHTYACFDISGE